MTLLHIAPPAGVSLPQGVPVEVRRPSLALVARATLEHPVEVEPGSYLVTARPPVGCELTGFVEAEGESATVVLERDEQDADDAALAPSPPAPLAYVVRRPLEGLFGRFTEVLARLPRRRRLALRGTPTVRIVAGNPLTRQVRVVQDLAETGVPFSATYAPRDDSEWPAYVSVLQSRAQPWYRALPVAPGQEVPVRPRLDENRRWTVDVVLAHPGAELLVRYRDRGWAQEAATVADGLERDAEGLLFAKLDDPIAAAAGAYALLRFSALERLHDWTENLRQWFPRLPDGSAVRGEHLARAGEHHAALEAFGELLDRGLPLFADGLAYAVTRLETYASIGEREFENPEIAQMHAVLGALAPFARDCDFSHPITTFSTAPGDVVERVEQIVIAQSPPSVPAY